MIYIKFITLLICLSATQMSRGQISTLSTSVDPANVHVDMGEWGSGSDNSDDIHGVPSGLESVHTTGIKIGIEGKEIIIYGIDNESLVVDIFDVSGKLVYSGTERRILLNHSNIYFVKIKNKVYKVLL